MRKAKNQIELSKEERQLAINEIISYFATEREEEIGELAGGLILDFILEKIGPHIYNQAVADMQKYIMEKADDMYGFLIE